VKDFLASHRWLVREERRITDEHLEEDHTHTPPVNAFIIPLLAKNLRCDIIRSTNSREGEMSGSLIAKFLVKD